MVVDSPNLNKKNLEELEDEFQTPTASFINRVMTAFGNDKSSISSDIILLSRK